MIEMIDTLHGDFLNFSRVIFSKTFDFLKLLKFLFRVENLLLPPCTFLSFLISLIIYIDAGMINQ